VSTEREVSGVTVGELTVEDPDGLLTVVQRWLPPEVRAVLHVLHGWGEHALRYDGTARSFAAAGYAVYADDHRGHGQSGVRSGTLGDLGPRGADGVLDAVHAVTRRAADEHPGLPVFVVGHSWGSMILQRYLRRWSDELAGALLTGTTYRDPDAPVPTERPSPNAPFEPGRTPYDWLTRDESEVDRYIADPLCGFEIMRSPPGGAGGRPATGTTPGKVPSRLPILVFNGADDPIGGEAGGLALADHYRAQGVEDVTFRAYPGARHELFNELERDQVRRDVLAWLDARS
jgi:alpha-beta hydrolase superfamily lysophospholipase